VNSLAQAASLHHYQQATRSSTHVGKIASADQSENSRPAQIELMLMCSYSGAA
jgi:hypothetical protein